MLKRCVNSGSEGKRTEVLFLKGGHRLQKAAGTEILLIESKKVHLRLYTARENGVNRLSFAKPEELLSVGRFARVHKSSLVALDTIDHLEKRIRTDDRLLVIADTVSEPFR
jgi:DNA-binding LytR/AlgR family response regulator